MGLQCRLLYFRLFTEWLTVIFFAASAVFCLWVYFFDDPTGLFGFERATLLTSAIVHIILCIIAFLSGLYTTKILRPYVSDEDKIYNGLRNLLGMVEMDLPIDIEAEEHCVDCANERVSLAFYHEPTEISQEGLRQFLKH